MNHKAWVAKAAKLPMVLETVDLVLQVGSGRPREHGQNTPKTTKGLAGGSANPLRVLRPRIGGRRCM